MSRRVAFAALAAGTLTALGAACLYVAVYVSTEGNTRPVQLALPPPGIVIAEPIVLTTAGTFDLEVSVPDTESKGDQGRHVPCTIRIVVEGVGGHEKTQV